MQKNSLFELGINSWQPQVDAGIRKDAVEALEGGKIIYLPNLPFELNAAEKQFVAEGSDIKLNAKSIKYSPVKKSVWGLPDEAKSPELEAMLGRYSDYAVKLVNAVLPQYKNSLLVGNSSFRPAEIEGRKQSPRQDDTRLHVDAFPSRPNAGQRILRVFTNANPNNRPRKWRVGESFENAANNFLPKISAPIPGSANVLKFLKITKSKRTAYDHYMLNMHDKMKFDENYQQNAPQEAVDFPPGSSWIVFTDQVSHAAMSGQFAFEQTFSLPVNGMANPAASPLHILEKLKGRKLA